MKFARKRHCRACFLATHPFSSALKYASAYSGISEREARSIHNDIWQASRKTSTNSGSNGKCFVKVSARCFVQQHHIRPSSLSVCSHSSKDMSKCSIVHIETGQIYDGNDHFYFPSILPHRILNPMTFTLKSWQGGIRLKGAVYDSDSTNSNDLVDKYYENILFALDGKWNSKRIVGVQSVMEIKYRAGCKTGYYGKNCITYCVSRNDERGHYTCNPVTGGKVCGEGWEGPNCDHDYNECLSEPCLNNGTCDHGKNHYTCVCPYGWGGHQCNLLMDPCIQSPCTNSLSCHPLDEGASYKCTCIPGWAGKDCDVKLNSCVSSPCQNGGQCVETPHHWSCNCINGWSGKACNGAVNIRLRDQIRDDQSGSGPWWISLLFVAMIGAVVGFLAYRYKKRKSRTTEEENQSDTVTFVTTSQPVVAFHRRSIDSDRTSTISQVAAKKIDGEEDSFTDLNSMVTMEKLKKISDAEDDEEGLIGAIGGIEVTDIYEVE
ncbi:delta-like protein 1 [Anneissia japonica]|uniref:delta-like protein 1 n=1 Tax=Anneissia japonica TaxID=1529436 RepID=UPI0014259332|nr:delta-like protein 1 [Anneissia japonica]